MGQPVRMLTSGNLDVRGLQDGSLHNFLLPANNRCLLVLSENRGFFICYLSMTEEFLLLIVILLLVVLVWELVLVVVVGLCVMVFIRITEVSLVIATFFMYIISSLTL